MPVLISDAAVVRDLDCGSLLASLSGLAEAFFIVDVLADRDIPLRAASALRSAGVRTVALGSYEMAEAVTTHRREEHLSLGECCALAFARVRRCPMLTSYGPLREAALNRDIPVCCALWCLDQIQAAALLDAVQLYASLQAMLSRTRCSFPPEQVAKRLGRFSDTERIGSTKARA